MSEGDKRDFKWRSHDLGDILHGRMPYVQNEPYIHHLLSNQINFYCTLLAWKLITDELYTTKMRQRVTWRVNYVLRALRETGFGSLLVINACLARV